MMVFIKTALLISLFFILYQDIKERQVFWFLFPIVTFCFASLFYLSTITELFLVNIALNICFVSFLLFVVLLYTKIKLKTCLNNTFGLGDILLFIGLAFTFSTVSFMVVFICALIFSLVLHLFIKQENSTVPLAGYMSLFFGLTYISYWFGLINSVYTI